MRHQQRVTSAGRIIDIYDDLFPQHLRHHHIVYAQNSIYTLGGGSTEIISQNNKTFFRSLYSKDDVDTFNCNHELFEEKFKNYSFQKSWVLASSPFSTYFYHPDKLNTDRGLTLLYYLNNNWDRDWGGETLFTNDYGECEIAVEFKPGRVVIFDSLIEHKPSAISMSADEFRFTFVIQFVLNENE